MLNAHPVNQAGFQEAVISVADLDEASKPWLEVAGWQQLGEDSDAADLLSFWSMPHQGVRQRLLHNPGSDRGFVRLVCFDSPTQQRIRSNAMPWESGGLLDLYLTVRDVRAAHDALRLRGWQSFADPVTYEFGGIEVAEIMTRGPDGIVLCLMEIDAWKDGDAYLKAAPFGQLFNSALTVPEGDYANSCAFFRDVLGWNTFFEGTNRSKPPGDNPIGLPRNLAREHSRKACIFINHLTDRTGSLLVLTFEGLDVRDHAEHAVPPNHGLFAVRVAVDDPAATAAGIIARGGVLASPLTLCDIEPYGRSTIFAVTTPSNARIEFFGPAAGES